MSIINTRPTCDNIKYGSGERPIGYPVDCEIPLSSVGDRPMSAAKADTPATAPKRRRLQAPVRRELILEAALRTFAEKGHGASMGDVAAAAGITRSVVYHYFPSKKDLLLEVLRGEMGALITHLAPVMTSADTPRARLHQTLDGLLTFADESPSSWKVLFGAYGSQSAEPAVDEALIEGYDAAIAVGIQVLTADVEATGLEPDSVRIRVLGEMFLATIVGVANWIHRHPEASKNDALTTMVDLLWQGLDGMLRAAANLATTGTKPPESIANSAD